MQEVKWYGFDEMGQQRLNISALAEPLVSWCSVGERRSVIGLLFRHSLSGVDALLLDLVDAAETC